MVQIKDKVQNLGLKVKSSIIITTKVVIVIVAQAMHPKSVLLMEKHVILVIRKATLSHIADPGNGAKMV